MTNKFNVGDTVRVDHPTCGTWQGKVLHKANCGDEKEPDWEYEVENAPELWFSPSGVLAWESEMTLIEKAS